MKKTHLCFQIIDLQFLGFSLDSHSYLTPVLGQVLDTLEGRNEFEADKALLVPLDMFKQELVLGDIGITEVELNLLDNLLTLIENTNLCMIREKKTCKKRKKESLKKYSHSSSLGSSIGGSSSLTSSRVDSSSDKL